MSELSVQSMVLYAYLLIHVTNIPHEYVFKNILIFSAVYHLQIPTNFAVHISRYLFAYI